MSIQILLIRPVNIIYFTSLISHKERIEETRLKIYNLKIEFFC